MLSHLRLFLSRGVIFALLKLVVKPHSLLLEAQRTETSSERHNKTSALLLIELALVELYHLLAY